MVKKALSLPPRGFVPRDVLVLTNLAAQLQLEWETRDIHPWDRNLPEDWQAALFREQALHDTDAAVTRLFRVLPEIDVIDIRVLAPRAPNRLLLAGTVGRQDLVDARPLASPGMRLAVMGVRYYRTHGQLKA
jgi:hypothetical protein